MSADTPDRRYGKDGNDKLQPGESTSSGHISHSSYSSHSGEAPRIIPPRGDYQTLLSFQKAEAIYDLTFNFAHKYLAKGDRTIDQMIQAARSGKKNI